jgi:uncharacterized ferritin-like protein (DUF455 family)
VVTAAPSALQHIENWAVDLSWDIIARFGSDPSYQLPREFFDDFVQVSCTHNSSSLLLLLLLLLQQQKHSVVY